MVQLCLEIFEPRKIVGIGLFHFLDGIHLDQQCRTHIFSTFTLKVKALLHLVTKKHK